MLPALDSQQIGSHKIVAEKEDHSFIVESRKPFSESKLWQFQADYFQQAGVEAWRTGEVAHYVTNNPVMGKTYAELVFAFLRDLSQRGFHEKVYLLELGAGHGRLCYHFLKHFETLVENLATPLPECCYVLSDLAEANLAFWQNHPRFTPYLESGWLDFARVDATTVDAIHLAYSGNCIEPESLEQPLIILANYCFDTIPQELFYIEDRNLYRCLATLRLDPEYRDGTPAGILKNLGVFYENEPSEPAPYQEGYLNAVLSGYVETLSGTYLLFPDSGIRCLHRLRRLSKKGALLLTADKGFHRGEDLRGRPAPELIAHGSFSLSVNYHAFAEYCLAEGGLPLFPEHASFSVDPGCLLFLPDAGSYDELHLAYKRFLADFNPDDFFSLKTLIQSDIQTLNLSHIMSAVRLSGFDANLFTHMLPRLRRLLAKLTVQERASLLPMVQKIWDMYLSLGEDRDLAYDLGELLFKLEYFEEALLFFQRSREARPVSLPTLYHLALCRRQLQQLPEANACLAEILRIDPDSPEAKALKAAPEAQTIEPRDRSALPSDLRLAALGNDVPVHSRTVSLQKELGWFGQVLETRLNLHFGQRCDYGGIYDIPPLDLENDDSEYARLVTRCGMGFNERLILILSLIPHIRPQALDPLFVVNNKIGRGYSELGGWAGQTHGGFLPTCETAVFILAGNDLDKRFEICRCFESVHFFAGKGILRVVHETNEEPFLSGALCITPEYRDLLTTGEPRETSFTARFPAKKITSKLDWADLVLPDETKARIERIHSWIKFGPKIMNDWGLDKILQPGYRSLFYGPPGTGKTLAACLIGQRIGVAVYRIDISAVVSKYIGETEKNLALLFDQARSRNWILFFDEADALFGKRTTETTVNDRHANQETAFLLQRIEDHPGIVILATNLKENIDPAFFRRFQSEVHFPMPNAEQRLKLWRQGLSGTRTPTEDLDMARIAEDYELSGGDITNAIRHGALQALEEGRTAVSGQDLLHGIRCGHRGADLSKDPARPAVMIRGPLTS